MPLARFPMKPETLRNACTAIAAWSFGRRVNGVEMTFLSHSRRLVRSNSTGLWKGEARRREVEVRASEFQQRVDVEERRHLRCGVKRSLPLFELAGGGDLLGVQWLWREVRQLVERHLLGRLASIFVGGAQTALFNSPRFVLYVSGGAAINRRTINFLSIWAEVQRNVI